MLALVLRDVHVPPTPPWWPPAPGWWLLAGAMLLIAAVALYLRWRRLRRQRSWERLFDQALLAASQPARVAAMSELLRRAARRIDPAADRLQGDDWLRFLDGPDRDDFSNGEGRLLLDGGYRRELDAGALETVQSLARRRFFELMAAGK